MTLTGWGTITDEPCVPVEPQSPESRDERHDETDEQPVLHILDVLQQVVGVKLGDVAEGDPADEDETCQCRDTEVVKREQRLVASFEDQLGRPHDEVDAEDDGNGGEQGVEVPAGIDKGLVGGGRDDEGVRDRPCGQREESETGEESECGLREVSVCVHFCIPDPFVRFSVLCWNRDWD